MFPYKSLFGICGLLSYWAMKLKFCPTFCHLICRPLIRTLPHVLQSFILSGESLGPILESCSRFL